MKALVLLLFIIQSSLTIFVQGKEVQSTKFGVTTPTPHRHTYILDPQGRYKLKWFADLPNKQIFFNVTVQTRGFVIFGIRKRRPENINVEQQDFIIGGVDGRGRTYFKDMYAENASQTPTLDRSQDWVLNYANETSRHTFLSFSRLLDTADGSQDIVINDDTTNLIWGYGETDNYNSGYMNATRGTVPRYLLDPDLTPRSVREGKKIDPSNEDVKLWSIQNTFQIPPKETTYWCRMFKLELAEKNHIIGYHLRINNQTLPHLHHMFVYRCRGNNVTAYEQYVNQPGEECYQQDIQEGGIPLQTCTEFKAGYAIGGLPFFLPDSMGIPIGETGEAEYFLQQTHYNNPEGRSDLISEHTFDIYHTPKLRANDGGKLVVGHGIPGSPSLLLPPGTTNHNIYGHCSSSCTRKMMGLEGIKVVGGVLHAHVAAKAITVQHFRDGVELPPIFQDENWNNGYQPFRLLREEVTVLPGDQLTVRCTYDTTHSNRTIVGGYSTEPNEMCSFFANHYVGLTEYTNCWSEIWDPEYTARYLAGASNLTWDQPRLEFAAAEPPHLAGMTVSEISDSEYVNWDMAQREQLKRDHEMYPQFEICFTYLELQIIFATGIRPPKRIANDPIEDWESGGSEQCPSNQSTLN